MCRKAEEREKKRKRERERAKEREREGDTVFERQLITVQCLT